jgi:N-acetylmuramic acid 6-phosphate etherase
MPPTTALGLHIAETSTQIAVLDSSLQVLAEAESVPFSDQNIENFRWLLNNTLHTINVQTTEISGVGVSVGNRLADRELLNSLLTEIFPAKPILIEHETIPALIAGAGHRFGVITLCDISAVTLGFNEKGERIQVGGWGHHIGPGGYTIARDLLQVIANQFAGAGLATALSGRVLMRLALQSAGDLMNWLNATDRKIEDIAALTTELVALENTDTVATTLILRAADGLAAQAKSAAQRLGLNGQRFPLIMAGSLFRDSLLLRTLFMQIVQAAFPGAAPHLLIQNGAVCAAMMALDAGGIALPQPMSSERTPPRRATERRNPLTVHIQERPTLDFVQIMNSEDQRVPRLIEPELDRIAELIDVVAERFANGGRLFFVGAGTSGRLAVLDAVECVPTFSTTLEELAGILAGGEAAMIHSIEGAEDDEAQGSIEIAARDVRKLDTVIGVAASGSTPFVVGALREAHNRGALTGCIVNNADSVIAQLVQYPIIIPTGPEVLMGSTRLKAGTAQKLVMNMLSTGVMMRVGRTFGNLMVDMQMSNVKLRQRASVIVAEATDLPLDEAADLLERCGGELKTAIASHLLAVSIDDVRARLKACQGNLYRCIAAQK